MTLGWAFPIFLPHPILYQFLFNTRDPELLYGQNEVQRSKQYTHSLWASFPPPASSSGRIEQWNLSGSVMLSGRKPLCYEGSGSQKLTLLKMEKISECNCIIVPWIMVPKCGRRIGSSTSIWGLALTTAHFFSWGSTDKFNRNQLSRKVVIWCNIKPVQAFLSNKWFGNLMLHYM